MVPKDRQTWPTKSPGLEGLVVPGSHPWTSLLPEKTEFFFQPQKPIETPTAFTTSLDLILPSQKGGDGPHPKDSGFRTKPSRTTSGSTV